MNIALQQTTPRKSLFSKIRYRGFITTFRCIALLVLSVTPVSNAYSLEHDSLSIDEQIDALKNIPSTYHDHYYEYDRYQYHEDMTSGFPISIAPQHEPIFFFSPKHKQWAAFDRDGVRVGYGRANGGGEWCDDIQRPCQTPQGEFHITRKGSMRCRSSKYPLPDGGAPMPFCMFFMGGNAIHGSMTLSSKNDSHGCIRIFNYAAYWLSHYFAQKGTRVVVLKYS